MATYKGIPFNGGLDAPSGTGSQHIVQTLEAIIDFLIQCTTPGRLLDNASGPSVLWLDRQLLNAAGTKTADYENAGLYTYTDGSLTIDWGNRHAVDAAGHVAIDWQTRLLLDASGATQIDWTNQELLDPATSTAAILWGTRLLLDASNVVAANWNARRLMDTDGSTAQIEWDGGVRMANLPTSDPASSGQLWNNAGVVSVSP